MLHCPSQLLQLLYRRWLRQGKHYGDGRFELLPLLACILCDHHPFRLKRHEEGSGCRAQRFERLHAGSAGEFEMDRRCARWEIVVELDIDPQVPCRFFDHLSRLAAEAKGKRPWAEG